MMINGRKINAIAISFPTTCINLPRRIPFQPMNYKDALTHPINDKLTKAKLIEISKSLQTHCLVDELTVIPMSKYYIDIRTRWQTHLNETRLLFKDVRYVFNYIKDKYNLVSTLIAAK